MRRVLLGALAALSLAAPAAAKDKHVFVDAAPVKDKPAVTLDPAKAYVLMRSDAAIPLYLMKVPTAADQAAYATLRAEALVEAKRKYVSDLTYYKREQPIAARTPGAIQPVKPIEPTEANFDFVAIEVLGAVGIGPLNRFAKAKNASTYLQEVTPGTYRIYGFLSALPGRAPVGSCFCMGSVQFDAKAGEIADLGIVRTKEAAAPEKGDPAAPTDIADLPLFAVADGIDARLAQLTVRRTAFRPIGKLPNYFGLTITRVPAMPGVMRYERDRIVDLTR